MVYGMIAQCVKCGNYEWNKKVEQNKITCPVCGYSWTFRKLPQTIDEYILFQDEEKQADLYLLRQILQQTLSEAEERISWSMPTYRKNHNILHFAAAKKHIGFYPGPEAVEEFREDLEKYSINKGTIRIPYGEIDIDLIKKIALWCWNEDSISEKK